jgi:hypothetical protein
MALRKGLTEVRLVQRAFGQTEPSDVNCWSEACPY